jgi:hypothetical protein
MRMPEPQQHRTGAAGRGYSGENQKATSVSLQTKHALADNTVGITPPPVVHDVLRSSGQPLDAGLRAFMEPRFGHDFSQVRVHTDPTAAHSAVALNARAYTTGSDVVFGGGEFRPQSHEGRMLLAHELTHVCQASGATLAIRRAVRTDGGKTKIKEADYQKGGKNESVGSRVKVAALIADAVPRAFTDTAEVAEFANGATDYIGDVKTGAAGTYWFRLPKSKLTVLGEEHQSPNGNAEDVITGLGTKRFKYEAFNEVVDVAGQKTPSAKKRIGEINKQYSTSANIDPKGKYKPELENAVFKALTGAMLTREFIALKPATMGAAEKAAYGSRATTSGYSMGDRVALYLTLGIHIAADLAAQGFGKPAPGELGITTSARKLAAYYTANKAELDRMMTTKDGDDLIGIYELTEPKSFAALPVLSGFVTAMHEYGTRYIQQLGTETGNKALVSEGKKLEGNPSAGLDDMSPAREAIMWAKIQQAVVDGYLVVGMGDAHRTNLTTKLDKLGVAHAFVPDALAKQQTDVAAKWTK